MPSHLVNRRVLVVDDDADYVWTMAQLLTMLGCTVIQAREGHAALALAEQFLPDVILLDLRLPGLGGHEVAKAVRGSPWGRDTLIVAVSGDGMRDARELSVTSGIDLHLLKPVDFDALLDALRAPPAQPIRRSEHTVLVVDDDPAGRYAVARGLGAAGFQVLQGSTGRDALDMAGKYDALVLDVCLPDLDGRDVTRMLRTDRSARMPIIHTSAVFVSSLDAVQGRESGADAYLVAPVHPNAIARTLDTLLAGRG